MSKDAYYEMCQMLGTEPDPNEIPVEFEDLPDQVQRALEIYSYLSDRWEGMSGTYMGKDYTIIFNLFNMFDITLVSEQQLLLKITSTIDSIRSEMISDKNKQQKSLPK